MLMSAAIGGIVGGVATLGIYCLMKHGFGSGANRKVIITTHFIKIIFTVCLE